MAFPVYTVDDLASITGRDAASFTNAPYVTQALLQATLLYRIGTNRSEMPTDETEAELVRYGILFMADAIYLSQPFHEILSNPFSSESIGSYSYSKASSAVANGLPTGVSWFDMAVNMTSLGRDLDLVYGGIEILELDAEIGRGHMGRNKKLIKPRKSDEPLEHGWGGGPQPPIYYGGGAESDWEPDPEHDGYLYFDED